VGNRTVLCAVASGAMLISAPANAAGEPPWTVESAKTVGAGHTVFWAQAGYPGIWLEMIHGLDPTLEIGGKFAFNYGFEGIVDNSTLGLDFQFLLRKAFLDNGRIRIAGRFDPGLLLYFPSRTTVVGLTFPIGVEFGFPVSSVVSINASFALPMYVVFANGGAGFVLPIIFGGGAEYLIERNLALTFKLALGPSIVVTSGYVGGSAPLTLYALFGVAYRFE
jgi:hypothetical protein